MTTPLSDDELHAIRRRFSELLAEIDRLKASYPTEMLDL